MAKVTWLTVALDDVQSIFEFVAQDSASSAERLANRIFSASVASARFLFPVESSPRSTIKTFVRSSLGNYRLMYHVLADEVEVLAVIHSARLLPAQHVET